MNRDKGKPLVSLRDGGADKKQFETRDSYLAAALMSVGIKPVDGQPVRIVTRANDPGDLYEFFFEPRSECGKYVTAALVQAWEEGHDWLERNPEHPFAYAMAVAMNYRNLLRFVKRGEKQVFMQRGKSIAMLPLSASAKLEKEILGNFSKEKG